MLCGVHHSSDLPFQFSFTVYSKLPKPRKVKMSKKDNNRVKSKRIVVTLQLDIVTFPSGSQWVTDLYHTDNLNTALQDARHKLMRGDRNSDTVDQQEIEATARQNLRDNSLYKARFKRIENKQLFSALRDMLGVGCLIDAAIKLNPWIVEK